MSFYDQINRMRAQKAAAAAADPYSTVAGVQHAQDAAITSEGAYGKTASDAYLKNATSFDASKALDTYARGAYGSISSALTKQLQSLSGQAVGAGRFDSGFYDEDQGVVVNNATQQLNDSIAQQAMGAASLQQQNNTGLAAFGQRATEDSNDLLMSRSEQVQNDAREEAARRRRKGGIAGAIGGALKGAVSGFAAGGPWGAAAGAAAGGIGGYGYN